MTYQDVLGQPQELCLEGFLARIFLHEYDHLEGLTFLDRIESTSKLLSEQEYFRQIINKEDELIERAMKESALSRNRILSERLRTVNQLKLYAKLLREGSWVEASIETGDKARKPFSKPDLRKMLHPIGPVVIFTASNFPHIA